MSTPNECKYIKPAEAGKGRFRITVRLEGEVISINKAADQARRAAKSGTFSGKSSTAKPPKGAGSSPPPKRK